MSIDLLPIKTQESIFQQLDRQSLLAARTVCRGWYENASEAQKELLTAAIANRLVNAVRPFEEFYQRKIRDFVPECDLNAILENKNDLQKVLNYTV